MTQMYVIGEDTLCCALGERLVADVLAWTLPIPAINTLGVTKLVRAIPRYVGLSRQHPVLCVADTDGKCALELVANWRPKGTANRFLLRLAVTEAESWLLADDLGFADFFQVSRSKIPRLPEGLPDPKRAVLGLASRSKRRAIRQEVISSLDRNRPGVGYNHHLEDFARNHWNARRAAESSPSLARALERLAEVGGLDG